MGYQKILTYINRLPVFTIIRINAILIFFQTMSQPDAGEIFLLDLLMRFDIHARMRK